MDRFNMNICISESDDIVDDEEEDFGDIAEGDSREITGPECLCNKGQGKPNALTKSSLRAGTRDRTTERSWGHTGDRNRPKECTSEPSRWSSKDQFNNNCLMKNLPNLQRNGPREKEPYRSGKSDSNNIENNECPDINKSQECLSEHDDESGDEKKYCVLKCKRNSRDQSQRNTNVNAKSKTRKDSREKSGGRCMGAKSDNKKNNECTGNNRQHGYKDNNKEATDGAQYCVVKCTRTSSDKDQSNNNAKAKSQTRKGLADTRPDPCKSGKGNLNSNSSSGCPLDTSQSNHSDSNDESDEDEQHCVMICKRNFPADKDEHNNKAKNPPRKGLGDKSPGPCKSVKPTEKKRNSESINRQPSCNENDDESSSDEEQYCVMKCKRTPPDIYYIVLKQPRASQNAQNEHNSPDDSEDKYDSEDSCSSADDAGDGELSEKDSEDSVCFIAIKKKKVKKICNDGADNKNKTYKLVPCTLR